MVDEIKIKGVGTSDRVSDARSKKIQITEEGKITVQDKVSISQGASILSEILPPEDFQRMLSTVKRNLEAQPTTSREEQTKPSSKQVANALLQELVKAVLIKKLS